MAAPPVKPTLSLDVRKKILFDTEKINDTVFYN